jgi:hypothetical protein
MFASAKQVPEKENSRNLSRSELSKRTRTQLTTTSTPAVKVRQMGKAATLFSIFAARWQEEVLIHKKASTAASVKSHLSTSLLPEFGKLAMGDMDSERVQVFLNRLAGKMSAKSVKNVWTTLRIMWNSAVAWKYVEGELRVELPKTRKLRMRCYSVEEVKRILANSSGAERSGCSSGSRPKQALGSANSSHSASVT